MGDSEQTNPIKQFRLYENLTIQQLAATADVSQMAVLRSEQGMYNEIPPALVAVVSSRGYSLPELTGSYRKYVHSTRVNNFGKLSTSLPEIYPENHADPSGVLLSGRLVSLPSDDVLLENRQLSLESRLDHPFVQWRLTSGIAAQIEICKLFCVHPARLSTFELRTTCLSVPKQLVSALLESGYPVGVLDELERRYQLYKLRVRKRAA